MRRPPPTTVPHAQTVAPKARGKGMDLLIPDILALAGSVVVLDVKGENLREAAKRGRTGPTLEASE